MSLLDFYKSHKEKVLNFRIEQLVKTAGDGNLKDNSECSIQFRKYLSFIPISNLKKLSEECLNSSMENKGFILQDIVNELGKRLDLFERKTILNYDGFYVLGFIDTLKDDFSELIDYKTGGKNKEHQYNFSPTF